MPTDKGCSNGFHGRSGVFLGILGALNFQEVSRSFRWIIETCQGLQGCPWEFKGAVGAFRDVPAVFNAALIINLIIINDK